MKQSALEVAFLTYWRQFGTRAQPTQQFKFCPSRKWRADFAWPRRRVILELDGGIYTRGRHTRPGGFVKDAEKLNAAVALGYAVLRIPGPLLTSDPLAVVEQVKQVLHARRVSGLRYRLACGAAHRLMCAGRV